MRVKETSSSGSEVPEATHLIISFSTKLIVMSETFVNDNARQNVVTAEKSTTVWQFA